MNDSFIFKLHKYKNIKFYASNKYDIEIFKSIINGRYSIPECHVEDNDIILDCGAHIGSFSYVASKKASLIFAFEPLPLTYNLLTKNITLWDIKSIIPVKKCIFSSNKKINLLFDLYRIDGSTLIKSRAKKLISPKTIKTECITIDNFVKKKNLRKIDFIKMDIEGSEIEAIRGARNVIKKFKPRMAIAAYHFSQDKIRIPEFILSIRSDYKYKLVNKSHNKSFGDLFFW